MLYINLAKGQVHASQYFINTLFFMYFFVYLFGITSPSNSLLLLVLSNACSSILYFYYVGLGRKSLLLLLPYVMILLGTPIISLLIYDNSWDGLAYHQQAIIELKNGWHPIEGSFDKDIDSKIWLNHYPKFTWSVGALIYSVTGKIEAAKFYQLVSFAALGTTIYHHFVERYRKDPFWFRLLVITICINPVLTNQLFTNYNDGVLYAFLLIYMIKLKEFLIAVNFQTFIYAVICGIILVNIKYTGLVYFCMVSCLFLVIYHKNFELKKSAVITFIAVASVLILLISFHPYLTNFLINGHIFYPLFGEGSIDILTPITPVELLDKNRLLSFFQSNLEFQSLVGSTSYDARLGGFGFAFPVTLIMSMLIVALLIINNSEQRRQLVPFIIFFIGITFINAAAWHARYVPFIWMCAATISFIALSASNFYMQKLAKINMAIQFLSAIIITTMTVYLDAKGTLEINRQLTQIKSEKKQIEVHFGPFLALDERLNEFGINFSYRNTFVIDDTTHKKCFELTWCEAYYW